ncbi:50S ribosomal protein L4 [Candidatus Marsarchaeota archaeon]|nr:50S ribosomal protein L4 [Candidatus Marsarchaeota archaeon]
MEANVYSLNGEKAGKIALPGVFSGTFRKDIVRRALLSEQSSKRQPQAHYVMAGLQTTATYVGTYGGYRHLRHMGVSANPRQKLAGGGMGDVRRIPSSVKGRRAHPHKLEKRIEERINKKEYIKALESAIAASADEKLIRARHVFEKREMPIIIENKLEEVSKTSELLKILNKMGLSEDLNRSHKPRLSRGLKRAAKSRHFRNSVLILVKNDEKIGKAGRNIPGVDVCRISKLCIEKLSPGAEPRMILWSDGAVSEIEKGIEESSNAAGNLFK